MKILDEFFRMPRFAPAIFAAFLSLLLLLFIGEVGDKVKLFLLPSLILYAQGAAFVGMIHRLIGLNYEKREEANNEKPIPVGLKILIYFIHLILLALLIAYNLFRCVL